MGTGRFLGESEHLATPRKGVQGGRGSEVLHHSDSPRIRRPCKGARALAK